MLSISNSPGTIINWQGFSISENETTNFIQQNATSSILNRVIGSDPSVILGTLTSNGRVFLINPSGILFGQGARVDVAGLVASTLPLSDQDFLTGQLNFAANPLAGEVENQGRITTPSGGSVYLVGASVANSGVINTPDGDTILAAGESVKIFDTSTPGVRVEITASNNSVVNLGEILAQSGEIGIYGATLRNAGIINADQVERDARGKIVLRARQSVTLEASSRISASGGQGSEITIQSDTGATRVSGTIDAKGTGTGQTGGIVRLLGDRVELFDHAEINVSGDAGGGTVLVGGNFHGAGPEQNAIATTIGANSSINADAIESGNGGRIAVWSDGDTSVAGMLSARGGKNSGDGGFIETSGHNLSIAESTRVNTLATHGKTGSWLIDPQDFTIAASGGDITGTVLSTNLGTADIEVQSSTGSVLGSGNVNVNDAVSWSANTILTLTASNDVNINADITATGNTAGLVINPNTANGADPASGTGVFNLNGASVTLSGTSPSLAIAGVNYTVINDLGAEGSTTAADLQGINGDLTTHYALGSNIDAADTFGWNAGAGFTPLGTLASPFSGTFDGLGHTISTLTINLTTPDVGLFGVTGSGAVIRNVGLVGGSVTGGAGTGALVGNNGPGTSISSSYSTASVSGAAGTGGLVGSSTTGAISNSYATGDVVGAAGTGGLVGSSTTGAISNSYATGDVIGGAGTGGLLGSNTSGPISTSFATGSVTGAAGTGGLIGSNTSGAISTSYATGNVNGGAAAGVGGLIGSNTSGTVMTAYAAGGVTGTGASRGALIGSSNASVVSNSFWDKTTSIVQVSAGGGLGMTTAEMMMQANFTSATTANGGVDPGWDFTNTWVMEEGITYPLLSDFITPLTVTANNDTKTYNGVAYSGGNGVTYSALTDGIAPAGTLSFSGTSQGALNVNSYVITPGGLESDQFYLITFIDGMLTVTQKAVTISGTTANDKAYDGNTLATLSSIGAVTTGVGMETLILNGPLAANINFNTKDVATANLVTGTGYSIADGTGLASNYVLTSSTATAAANITPRAVSITGTRVYDASTNFAAGTFGTAGTISTLAGETLLLSGTGTVASKDVVGGSQAVDTTGLTLNDVIATGGLASNYTFSGGTQTATVTPANLILGGTRVYDGSTVFAGSNLTATGTGSETFAVTGAGDTTNLASKNVQTGSTLASLTGLALGTSGNGGLAGNYTALSTTGSSVDVTARSITLTAPSVIKTYDGGTAYTTTGADLAAIGASAPLVGSDTISAVTISYANRDVGLGNKTVTLSGSTIEDGNSGMNYTILAENGNSTSTINKATLTVAANSLSKVYGTGDPVLGYTTGAFQFGDTAGSVLSGALSRAAGEDVNAYAIGQNTLVSNANYTIDYTGNNLSITPATLNVAANSQSKLFGQSDPPLTFVTTGLVTNPTLGIADTETTVLSGALTRVPGESALGGPYAITQGSLVANSNYILGFAANNLTIIGAAAEPILGFNAVQVNFFGVINNAFYYRPGNFWHVSLNSNNADTGFDVMRGTNDLKSRPGDRLNRCDSVIWGGFCETWSFPQQRVKVDIK